MSKITSARKEYDMDMINEIFELTNELCMIPAVPGREKKLAAELIERITPYVDEVHTDKVGNVIAKIEGDGADKRKIMYLAHMDEVSGIVSKIENDGKIRYIENGGLVALSCVYNRVMFTNGTEGILLPLTKDTEVSCYNCYVDIGATSKEEAEKYVKVGDCFIAPEGIRRQLGTRIAGHPIDDRIGCALLLLAAKELKQRNKRPENDVYIVFTAMEELAVPSVGAATATFEIRPDVGISVDVCMTGDGPLDSPVNVVLGGGAAIHVKDTTMICDEDLVREMTETCEENGIRYQHLVEWAGGNDSVTIQKTADGCRASLIDVPMHHLHTCTEQADLSDAAECLKLIVGLCDRKLK